MPALLQFILIGLAVIALLGVVLEDVIHVNKAKVTLFLGTLSWFLLFIFHDAGHEGAVNEGFLENISEIASLWLFLVAAMTFVAYLNQKGMIENLIHLFLPKKISERRLLFLTAIFCFVFSSLADNITATLVSVTLILSLNLSTKKTVRFATLVVFSVNSGGVSLITGDVTTLMIFLADKVSILDLLMLSLPAFIAVLALAILLSRGMSETVHVQIRRTDVRGVDLAIAAIFLTTIIGTIVSNVLFNIPPVLTFLLGLSVMFLVARFYGEDEDETPILEYIRVIEFETLLFFLGILLLVGMLKEIEVLDALVRMYEVMPPVVANYVMGILSAAIDNVPLTAALLKAGIVMTEAEWLGLTYAVGVGGSLLVIGSAAGIVAMSKVSGLTFGSYARYSFLLLIVYTVGYAASMFLAETVLGAG
ncbi:sodium:proton antiporter NhaD [Marinomonas balearica]|uniref:Sodium/proton antiporter (NhaD family) n=1 Tax=Marinomonas balearica TaxID=491947 RepID=A0A4R6M3P5_9GAMM|nr:sodium:proton antiporter NhaD [Marinomonas balearica]TDO95911.1 sodium/proton antiporter (NhaD family) [Marinomonas balearica]